MPADTPRRPPTSRCGAVSAPARQEGVEDLSNVKRMYLEADGEMSVILNDETKTEA